MDTGRNYQGWAFRATPRELQFLVVGGMAGILGTLVGKSLDWPPAALFPAFAVLFVAFLFLGFARN